VHPSLAGNITNISNQKLRWLDFGKIDSGGGNVSGHYQYVQCPTVYGDGERGDICTVELA